MTQINHSSIIKYPINYDDYPLARDCKIIKVELKENQYLYIPPKWNHWVFTEPETIALSFDILNIYSNENGNNNEIFKMVKEEKPFKKNGNKFKFNYNKFINNHLNSYFMVLYSKTFDCIPVYKNKIDEINKNKIFAREKLNEILNNSMNNGYYAYIGQYEIPINNNFKEIVEFINFDDYTINKYKDKLFDFNFNGMFFNYDNNLIAELEPKIWITIDKGVDSGLHNDENAKFLYVLSGKKTVYLISPIYSHNLYFKEFNVVPKIFNKN